MQDKEMLGREPVGKLLLKLSIPTVVAQLINMLYNIVDRIFIGHIPNEGALALTGVGVCLPLIMLVSAFAALIASGGAPRASIFMGQNDMDKAEKTLGGCFTAQIIISAILTTLLLVFNRDLLILFGASENTIDYAVKYMNTYAIGTLFVQLTLGMNAFITAQGYSKFSMYAVLIGAILNICLDPLFIYVAHMGVQGAALATIISQFISCIFVVSFLCSKKSLLKLKVKNLFPGFKIVLPCIGLGMSAFMMQASESIIFVCFNSSLLKYGGDIAVGAMTILSSVMSFAMLPLQGLAQGAQPIESYNYGAGNKDRVKQSFKLLLITSLCYSVFLFLFVEIFPKVFASMFTSDPELLNFTAYVCRIYFGGMFMFGAQIACQMTFVSLGKALQSVIVAVVRKFVLLLPLIYLLPIGSSNPTIMIYMAEPIADAIAVTFTVILFAFEFRKALKNMKKPVDLNNNELDTGKN